MSTGIQEEIIEGRPPTRYEQDLIAWADNAAASGITLANDGLRLLATLSTSLLAGSAFLVAHLPAPAFVKWLSAVCLLVSLFCCLVGLLPQRVVVDDSDLDALERLRSKTAARKRWLLRGACAGLLIGLALMVGGALAGDKAEQHQTTVVQGGQRP